MEYIRRSGTRASLLMLVTFILLTAILSGCQKNDTSPQDGEVEIISKELIEILGQNPNIDIYKVFYKSDGIKVLAYLTVPKAPGKYPLVVNLHGGFSYEDKTLTHQNPYLTYEYMDMSDQVVYLYPAYRGYLESEGHVQGIAENTRDADNGIKLAMSTGRVKEDAVYLIGASMGGAVALRLASERQDVQAVVGIAPFTGWDVIIRWLDEHPGITKPKVVDDVRKYAFYVRNSLIKLHPESEGDYSILDKIPNINAPVLLLQGTEDDRLIWQTVQDFSNDLEEAGKTVKFVLYEGGDHSLGGDYLDQRNQEIHQWLQKYGLTESFTMQ